MVKWDGTVDGHPDIAEFISRHGREKVVKFLPLYEAYKAGKIPMFLIAGALKVTTFEIAVLIDAFEDLERGAMRDYEPSWKRAYNRE